MKEKFRIILLVLCGVSFSASASMVRYDVYGTVTSMALVDVPFNSILIGDQFFFSITYKNGLPYFPPRTNGAGSEQYFRASSAKFILGSAIDTLILPSDQHTTSLGVRDGIGTSSTWRDEIKFQANSTETLPDDESGAINGIGIDGRWLDVISVRLICDRYDLWTDERVESTFNAQQSDFDELRFAVGFSSRQYPNSPAQPDYILGQITSLSVSTVPLNPAILYFLSTLVTLVSFKVKTYNKQRLRIAT